MGKRASGYTLIELLVVVGIIVLISTIGLLNYHDINRSQTLNQQAKDLASAISLAQNNAISQKKPSGNCTLQGYNFDFKKNSNSYTVKALCVEDDITTLTGFLSPLISVDQDFNISFLVQANKEVLINKDLSGIKVKLSIDPKQAYLIVCKGGVIKVENEDPGTSYCP